MFRKATLIFNKLSHLGITDQETHLGRFRKRVINRTFFVIGLTCGLLALQATLVNSVQDVYVPVIIGMVTFAALSLNYFRLYLLAQLFLTFFYPTLLLFIIFLYGPGLRLEYTISLFLVFAFILYDDKRLRIINLVYLVLIQFFGYYYTTHEISAFSQYVDTGDSIIVLLGTTLGLALLVYKYASEHKVLLEQQQILNRDLNAKNEELESIVEEKVRLNEQLLEKTRDLRRSNEFLESYTYIASHDLKTPIRGISGFSALLQKKLKSFKDEDIQDYLKYISTGVIQLNSIVDGIIENAESNRSNLHYEYIDCMELIQGIEHKLRLRLESIQGHLVFRDLPFIYADKGMLAKVFYYLIDNGFKYNHDQKPEVLVTYRKCDKKHEFSISDNGIGVPPPYQDDIFKMFKKLHPKQEYGGSGVGLALCKKIIELHRGEIWLEQNVQEGSIFRFTIPHNVEIS